MAFASLRVGCALADEVGPHRHHNQAALRRTRLEQVVKERLPGFLVLACGVQLLELIYQQHEADVRRLAGQLQIPMGLQCLGAARQVFLELQDGRGVLAESPAHFHRQPVQRIVARLHNRIAPGLALLQRPLLQLGDQPGTGQ